MEEEAETLQIIAPAGWSYARYAYWTWCTKATPGAAGVPGLRRWMAIVAANAVASERQSTVHINIEAERRPCAGKRDMTTGNVETRFDH